MTKITLGKPPESFKRNVSETLLDGTLGEIGMVYKYRTRKQFANHLDEFFGADAASMAKPDSIAQATQQNLVANADYILSIANGWDLPDEFTRESVQQLCDEHPGLALKIMSDYRVAITEGRLGN